MKMFSPLGRTNSPAKVMLPGITWTTLEVLLADGGDARSCRIAYNQGFLELRMPIPQHEITDSLRI